LLTISLEQAIGRQSQLLIFPLPLPNHLQLVNSSRPIGPPACWSSSFSLFRPDTLKRELQHCPRAPILSGLLPALA